MSVHRVALIALSALVGACSLVGKTPLGKTSSLHTSSSDPVEVARESGGGDSSKSYWSHEDLQTLRGLTVEKATAKARSLGFTGWVRTQVSSTFIEGCEPNLVCDVDDSHGMGGGVAADDGMMLYTNKDVDIPDAPLPE